MKLRLGALGLAVTLALAGCDPAGPANVRLIPLGAPGADAASEVGNDAAGAPLDAMRPDASPMASSAAAATDAGASDGSQAPADLAAAATAAVADTSSGETLATDNAALAAHAQASDHAVGTAVYARDFASAERAERACARYASVDQAQGAFLAAGGPEQDPRGLDPDGDGYACGWDPAAFRASSEG